MNYYKSALALLMIFSTNSHANTYLGIGLELGYSSNDMTLESFPILNIKGQIGYRYNQKFSVELAASASAKSLKSGDGSCSTTIQTTVDCTRDDEVKRQAISLQGVYTWQLSKHKAFSALGLGIVKSAYRSTITSDEVTENLELIDAKSTDTVLHLEVGALLRDKHRVALVWDSPYGNAKTGEFNYFGASYSYLLKWGH